MEKPWIKNAQNYLIVNTIFAALAGVLLVAVFQDSHFEHLWPWPVAFFAFSLWMFAWTAERIPDSVDEENVRKHVAYMAPYNLGVMSLFVGLAFVVHGRYSVPLPYTITIAIGLLVPWILDLRWLLFSRPSRFQEYLRGLEEDPKSLAYETLLSSIFYGIRRMTGAPWRGRNAATLPHGGVYTRIQRSPIHGVGVFAIRDIPKGTKVFEGDDADIVWIERKEIEELVEPLKQLYEDFCIFKGGSLGCPRSFNQLTVSWYLNESKDAPNIVCDDEYEFYTARDIKAGEELTVDYSSFSEDPATL